MFSNFFFSDFITSNTKLGIGTRIRNRYLTKAFGLENCPCITHLLNDKPYLSIGPNDDFTKVHGPNESMDTNLLPISFEHLNIVFREVESLA